MDEPLLFLGLGISSSESSLLEDSEVEESEVVGELVWEESERLTVVGLAPLVDRS